MDETSPQPFDLSRALEDLRTLDASLQQMRHDLRAAENRRKDLAHLIGADVHDKNPDAKEMHFGVQTSAGPVVHVIRWLDFGDYDVESFPLQRIEPSNQPQTFEKGA